jgi:hypothetical protein
MADIQHLPDIIIPDIDIDKGWPASSVKTIEDCDDAYAFLMSAIAQIEFQIDEAALPNSGADPRWVNKAKCALKYKRAALNIVNLRRGRIEREQRAAKQVSRDRALLDHIRANTDAAQFKAWVQDSNCNEEMAA